VGSRHMVICDSEQEYAVRLMEWLMERKELDVQIHVIQDILKVQKFSEEQTIDALFVEDTYTKEERERIRAVKKFLICRKKQVKEENYIPIWKYQSAEKIYRIFAEENMKTDQNSCFRNCKKRKKRVAAIYALAGEESTEFALELGKTYSRSKNTLYLNLHGYGILPEAYAKSGMGISDLLYFARQEDYPVGTRVSTSAMHMEQLDYLLPPEYAEEVKEVSAAEWIELFSAISENSIYEVLIIDLGNEIQGLNSILAYCDDIIAVCSKRYERIWTKFIAQMRVSYGEHIVQKICRIEHRQDWESILVKAMQENADETA